MAAILIVSLVLSVVVTIAMGVAALLSVAFFPEADYATCRHRLAPGSGGSRPVRGARQRSFSESRGTQPRSAPISPGAREQCRIEDAVRLPIRVTPPEVLAIADRIRATKSPEDYAAIASRARKNAEHIDQLRSCPLLEATGTCAAFPVRPIWCRTCALCTGQENQDVSDPLDDTVGQIEREIERGLCAGLGLAELDGNQYELNDALAIAMTTPDAAQQWGRGAAIFASCQPC